jgi:predicted GIY-YIG superfamily endonuclease
MVMAVYILHIEPSYKHAAHYTGFANDVAPRLHAHLHKQGARLTQVAIEAGCTLLLVRVWQDGDRAFERKLKRNSHVPMLCPICRGEAVQMPLMPWMPAYTPQDEQGQSESDRSDDQPQHTDSLFDFDAEADDYEEDMLDREFWRRGSW